MDELKKKDDTHVVNINLSEREADRRFEQEKAFELRAKSSQIPLVPPPGAHPDAECARPLGSLAGPGDFPEGGTQAWLVACGTAGIMFCTLGFANSFGVFQAYYIENQLKDHSPDDISWIGSLQVCLVFAIGVIGGPLFDRYGAFVIRPAALVYLAAIMMTASCKKYWQFILVQGLLSGVSNSLLMFPSMAATPQYFNKKRGAAMGLAIAGSSLGAIIFPIVLSRLLDTVGFEWAVRACGFIMMPILLFSALTVKARLPPRESQFFLWSAFKSTRFTILIAAVFFMFMGMFVPLFYLPAYGISRGMDHKLAFYLVAIINAASIPGRIIPGILGDKFGTANSLVGAGGTTALIIFCWPSAKNNAGIIMLSMAFGMTSGAIISSGSVVFTHCASSPKDIGTYMGMGIAIASLAVLIGPPINGALLTAYGSFNQVSAFSGAMCAIGTLLAFLSKMKTREGLWGKV